MKIFFNKILKYIYLIAPFLFLLSVLFIKFGQLIYGKKILFYGDIETYFMPVKVFAARIIKNGKIPLWSHNLFAGYPIFADPQSGIYYVLNVLLDYSIPHYLVINYSFLISIILTSFSFYLFSRIVGIGKIPSIISSLLFTYSGFILLSAYVFVSGYWFIPAIFLCFELYINNKMDIKYIFIAGLLLSLQIFATSPEIPFITLIGLISYSFFRLFLFRNLKLNSWFYNLLIFLKFIVFTFIIGFMISMVQIIPTFIEGLISNTANVSKSFVLQGSLKPINLIKDLLGTQKGYFIFFGFLTPFFLFLIILSLRFKKKYSYNNIFNAFFFTSFFIFLIAFGKYFPLYNDILIRLPFFDKFPLPQRYMIIAVFAFSVLSGMAIDILLNHIKLKNIAISALMGYTLILLTLYFIFKIPSQFDLMTNYKNFNKIDKVPHFLNSKLNDFDGRVYAITGIYPFKIHLGPNSLPYTVNNSLSSQIPLYYNNIDSITGTKVFVLKDYRKIIDTARSQKLNSKLFKLLNLKYIITGKPVGFKNNNHVILTHRYNINGSIFYLYRLKHYLKRIFFVRNIISIKENYKIFKKLLDPAFNPQNTAYILNKSKAKLKYNNCRGKAIINKWNNNKLTFTVNTNNKCFLFVSNSFFPGWKAYINNKETKIYKTDYNFQGVFLNKGNNNVVFKFKPFYFYIGELISIISFGNTILLLLYFHFKKDFK